MRRIDGVDCNPGDSRDAGSARGTEEGEMKLDALVVAAHRDDVEITCGGLILKLVDAGHRVGVLDLTQGEMGTLGSARLRAKEAAAAAKILGIADRLNAGLPDAHVKNDDASRAKIVRILRKVRPEVVVVPCHEQRHPDHSMTPKLLFDACFFAGLRRLRPALGEPFRPRKILYAHSHYEPLKPTFCVDITAQFERKLAAIRCYSSQFPGEKDPKTGATRPARVFRWIADYNRYFGNLIGAEYAEPYVQREMIEVEDVVKLKGHSM